MQRYRSPLVGRHEEVAEVVRVLRATGPEARTLLVTGAAGSGRTALLHEARRAAAKSGAKVLRLDWEVAEGGAGPEALADAVRAVLAKVRDGRVLARVNHLRRARAEAAGGGGEVALLAVLGDVLADAARHVPFALVVDDADRMPDATASALGLALRVFRPAGVPVVLTARPTLAGRPGGAAQLLAAADGVTDLPPLSPAEVGELVVRRLDRPVEPDLVTALLRALGPLAGRPGAVLSVLAALEDRGGLLELDGLMCLTVPENELQLTANAAELAQLGWPQSPPPPTAFHTATTLAHLLAHADLHVEDLHRTTLPTTPPGANRSVPDTPSAGRPEAGPSGAGRSEAGPSGAGPFKPGLSGAGAPEPGPSEAVAPRAVWSGAGEPEPGPSQVSQSEPGASNPGPPEPGESGAGVPRAGRSEAGASESGQPGAGAPNPGASEPGESGTGVPRAGRSEAGASEPGQSVAGASEPSPSEISSSEAGESGPGAPGAGRPEACPAGAGQPGAGAPEPGPSEISSSEPGESEPGESEPGPSEPGPSEPGPSEPGPSEPGAAEDGAPGAADPPGAGAAETLGAEAAPSQAPPARAGVSATLGRAVDGLVRDRVVTVDRAGRVSFAVPALAAALRALPGGHHDVRPLHATITRSFTDRLGAVAAGTVHPRLAGHVAAAGAALDATLAVPLLLAAARTSAKSEPSSGARGYYAALRHLPPYDPATATVLRESAALSLRSADHVGVLALGEQVLECLEARGAGEGTADRDDLEWVTRACALSTLHEHRSPRADDVDPRYAAALTQAPTAAALAALGALYGIGPTTPTSPNAIPHKPPVPGLELAPGADPATATATGARLSTVPGPGASPNPAPAPLARSCVDPLPSLAEVRLLAAAVGGHARFEGARQALAQRGSRGGVPDRVPDGAPGQVPDRVPDGPAGLALPAVVDLDRLRGAAAYGDLAGAFGAVLGERYVGAGPSTAGQYHGMVRDYLAGRWDRALSTARRIEARGRADGVPGVAQPARALAAEIQLVRGKLGRAREWLDLIPDSVGHPLVARARLGVRYWSGQGDEAMEAAAVEAAWRDVRRAREDGLLAGVDRVLLRILSIAVERNDPEAVRRAAAEIEALHDEVASPMTREAVLAARGMAHGDADSALAAYELVRERGDVPLQVDCCGSLAEVGDDPGRWLAEATRSGHALGMGRPVRNRLGAAARRRNVSLPRGRGPRGGPDGPGGSGGSGGRNERGERDVQLIELVSDGSTNRQVAARLGCSEKTVEQRLTRLFRRTGCRSRAELAAAWLDGSLVRRGLLPGPAAPDRPGGDGPSPVSTPFHPPA
ncbi:AAA family ATPase [Streptomyces liangshanensis]|uniref:AAA family ATPase n=1 Tax=Streptomyces liangshanensis TaxID=2717324 RepID=UPI0036D7CA45